MIDAGAGHGELCILFRRHGCQAFAIEPDTTALSVLHANMALNGLSRSDIAVLPKYVGTSIDQDHIGLDRVEVDRSKPGFIKIDIEGFETDALESANSLLDESDVTLLIEVHSKELEAGCIGILSSHGYTCRIIDNSRWRALIPERRLVSHNRWILDLDSSLHRVPSPEPWKVHPRDRPVCEVAGRKQGAGRSRV